MEEFKAEISVEELIKMYSDMVYRLAYSRTHNMHDAEDITQDVFMKCFGTKQNFNSEEHRKAWLIRVTVNTGKSFVTSAWFRHRGESDENREGEPFELIPEKSGVYYAVQSLPLKYRDVVHLFYYEELTVSEICSILKIKESTVKSLLFRARGLLREKLKEEDYEL